MFLAPKDVTTALWFYAGLEGEGDIDLINEEDYFVNRPLSSLLSSIPQLNNTVLTLELCTGSRRRRDSSRPGSRPGEVQAHSHRGPRDESTPEAGASSVSVQAA